MLCTALVLTRPTLLLSGYCIAQAMWDGTAVADAASGSCPSRGLMFVIGEGLNANGWVETQHYNAYASSLACCS